jgi:acyl-CoA synthetase (AMP-forming)/AMP-acid ligase II
MAELLQPMVDQHGDALALGDERGWHTWSELADRTDRWIGALHGSGLAVGDRVALMLGNRRETFEVLLACLHIGLVAVPVNWRLTAPEVAYLLDDSGCRAVVTETAYAGVVAEAVAQVPTPPPLLVLVDEPHDGGFAVLDDLRVAIGAQACSGAVLLYTSGTSGRPKGVVNPLLRAGAPLPHVAGTAAAVGDALGIPTQGRALLAGPWYHSAQLFFAMFPLLRGNGVVMRHAFDPVEMLDVIDREEVGITHLVPTQMIRLLRVDADRRAAFRGDSLERVWHGGAACPIDVKHALLSWWGPVFVEYYAATEAGIVTLIDSAAWSTRPGSVGRATPPTEVVVVGPDGADLPPGVVGTIGIRRPPGRGFHYHEAPEKTASAYLAPETFTVGDLGYLDEDGYLFLTGRSVEIIVSGGVNIYPAEVESVLLLHPSVADACVFGVPDNEFGERVHALVQPSDGTGDDPTALAEILDRHCRAQLAGFKVPRSYEQIDRMPREPTGKLAKHALREPYWSGTGRSM